MLAGSPVEVEVSVGCEGAAGIDVGSKTMVVGSQLLVLVRVAVGRMLVTGTAAVGTRVVGSGSGLVSVSTGGCEVGATEGCSSVGATAEVCSPSDAGAL
jgi:hypothetical protein